MTNEQIIEHGGTDMLKKLWKNNRGIIIQMAGRWPRVDGVDFDDLLQSGFLAVAEAAERFDPTKGKFTTCLEIYLKKYFSLCNSTASGWTRGQYQRGVMPPRSLNEAIYSGDGDEIELLDTIASPEDLQGEAEERIYRVELHNALEKVLATLPPEHGKAVRLRYLCGCTYEMAGVRMGLSGQGVRWNVASALRELRHPRNRERLRQFLDGETNFYRHSGVSAFNTTFTSDVEKICMSREAATAYYTRLILSQCEEAAASHPQTRAVL